MNHHGCKKTGFFLVLTFILPQPQVQLLPVDFFSQHSASAPFLLRAGIEVAQPSVTPQFANDTQLQGDRAIHELAIGVIAVDG